MSGTNIAIIVVVAILLAILLFGIYLSVRKCQRSANAKTEVQTNMSFNDWSSNQNISPRSIELNVINNREDIFRVVATSPYRNSFYENYN